MIFVESEIHLIEKILNWIDQNTEDKESKSDENK
jgi:hypothetical protein